MKIYNIVLTEPKPFMEVYSFARGLDTNIVISTLEDHDDRTYQCHSEKVAEAIKEKFGGVVSVIEFDSRTLLK